MLSCDTDVPVSAHKTHDFCLDASMLLAYKARTLLPDFPAVMFSFLPASFFSPIYLHMQPLLTTLFTFLLFAHVLLLKNRLPLFRSVNPLCTHWAAYLHRGRTKLLFSRSPLCLHTNKNHRILVIAISTFLRPPSRFSSLSFCISLPGLLPWWCYKLRCVLPRSSHSLSSVARVLQVFTEWER